VKVLRVVFSFDIRSWKRLSVQSAGQAMKESRVLKFVGAQFLPIKALSCLAAISVPLFMGCSATPPSMRPPALHVIGVHEGKPLPDADNRPWWAKCDPNQTGSGGMMGCHMKYASVQIENEVVVNITDDSRPIVLALTAYNKTHWKVSLGDGVILSNVILGGYHSQRVSGIPSEAPIAVYTHDASPCERCWQAPRHFYSYQSPPDELKAITGLEITSFQGRYRGTEFSIFAGLDRK
jgi:hypothetical protein